MSGFGGMVSVRMRGGPQAAHDFCSRTEVFILAESLGGVESLIEYPGAMTHASTAGSQLEVPDDLVRLSVGIEDLADLLADLEQALALGPPRTADAVIAKFTSGNAVGYSSTQLPLAISPALACTHRQPRSLRLSSAPSPSTACNNEMIAAVDGAGGLRSNNADNSAERAWPTRSRLVSGHAYGWLNRLDFNRITPDLPGPLQVVGEVVLGVLGQPLDRGGGTQRPSLQQLERRRDDGIHRAGNGERHQPAGLDRLTRHRRPNSARVRQVQQHRAGEHAFAAGTVKTGLSGRVVQQQQKQVLGDLRHTRTE